MLPFEIFNLKGLLLELFKFDKPKKEFVRMSKGLIDGPNIRNDVIKVFDLYEKSNYLEEVASKKYIIDSSISLLKISGLLIDFSGKKLRIKVETNSL